ncbi:MAG: hypothetical protein ACE5HU_09650 [Acidobacteriota bacterium]
MLGFLAVASLAIASSVVGFALNIRWLLPILNALPAYGFLFITLRRGMRGRAVGLMICWAACLALTSIWLTMHWPERAAEVILNGSQYRDEMLDWLSTGAGRESTPALFIPQHLLHATIFCILALATAGVASLVMGAALMNYMSFYVGDLIARCTLSGRPLDAVLLAWNPWSMVRVVAFIILGVVLAEPLLSRLPGAWPDARLRLRWMAIGGGGLVADVILKTLLAPTWPALLGGCLG